MRSVPVVHPPSHSGVFQYEHLVTSEQFQELDALPPRVLFVGGGYISFEFGHVAARAGAEVMVVHNGEPPDHIRSGPRRSARGAIAGARDRRPTRRSRHQDP